MQAISTAHSARKLRLGILGLGLAGGIMVPIAARHPRVAFTAAADLNGELLARLRRDQERVQLHSDALSLMASDEVDAVYIATPHQFHREHVLLAARFGKHVLVEKPIALTLEDCDEMIAAARSAGIVLMVGHTHGFDPAVVAMRDLTLRAELGPLAMLAMWNYTDFLYRPRRPEELDTALGGGIVFNQIPHQVEIARMIAASEVRSVRAVFRQLDPGRPTEGCCSAMLDFNSGVSANMVYSGYDHFDSDELHGWVSSSGFLKKPNHGGARRALNEGGRGAAEQRLRAERYGYGSGRSTGTPVGQPHFGQVIATYARGDVRLAPHGITVYSEDGVRDISIDPSHNGRTSALDEFSAAVIDGQAPLHDGTFARATLETCLAMLRSSQTGREVQLRVGTPAAEYPIHAVEGR